MVTDKLSGKKLRYHFNDCGNLLALSDELGFGAFASYAPGGPLNKPEAVSRLQKSVCNLMRDPLMEREDVWQQTVSKGAGTFAYDTDTRSIGWRSPRMDKTSDGGSAGGEDSDGWCGSGMASTHAGAMHGGVETALLEARGKPGKVWYDGAQVEAGVTPGRLNLLSNGDFAFDAMDWEQENGVTVGAVYEASGLAGLASGPQGLGVKMYVMLGGGNGMRRALYQMVRHSGKKGEVYAAGGWSMAHSLPRKAHVACHRSEPGHVAIGDGSGGADGVLYLRRNEARHRNEDGGGRQDVSERLPIQQGQVDGGAAQHQRGRCGRWRISTTRWAG